MPIGFFQLKHDELFTLLELFSRITWHKRLLLEHVSMISLKPTPTVRLRTTVTRNDSVNVLGLDYLAKFEKKN